MRVNELSEAHHLLPSFAKEINPHSCYLKKNFLKDENKRFYKGRFREASESSWVEKAKRNFKKENKSC
jgi:hypothetical protein